MGSPGRCTSSGDKEGGSRPKEAADGPVPHASRQQQAAELISSLLKDSLNAQQQTQALVMTLLERQAQGQEAVVAHEPDQLQALFEAALARQHADVMKALSGLVSVLEEQQARQEARHQQQLDLLTRLLEQQQQQQQQQQQEAAAQQQEGQVLRQLPEVMPHQAAQEAQPQAVAATTPEVPLWSEKDKQQGDEFFWLLDFVRVDMGVGNIIRKGTKGLVLASEGELHKVWSLEDPSLYGWFWDFQLARIPDEGFPKTAILTENDRDTYGVPVTRFTAAPGMLVRKGSYVSHDNEEMDPFSEIGVIQPSRGMGDVCRVMWDSGWEQDYEYCTGFGNRFELVHVAVSPTSGAPVVADWMPCTVMKMQLGKKMEVLKRPEHLVGPPWDIGANDGVAVERGTHWTYGGADPGVGSIRANSAQEQREQQQQQQKARHDIGLLPVRWPNGQLVPHRASPAHGYDLCYSARPRDPVTLFTAREGLRVDMGGGVQGTLSWPQRLHDDGVEWDVVSDTDFAGRCFHKYLVKSHGSERMLTSGPDGSPLSGTLEFAELP